MYRVLQILDDDEDEADDMQLIRDPNINIEDESDTGDRLLRQLESINSPLKKRRKCKQKHQDR